MFYHLKKYTYFNGAPLLKGFLFVFIYLITELIHDQCVH